jgi:hypothetical protein
MPITDWPENAALQRLIAATLTFKDIYGPQGLRGFLLQELARETILGELAQRNKVLAGAEARVDAELAEHLDLALKALEFYADADNYLQRKVAPSKVAIDRGKRARAAFEAISGEAETDDDGEGE